MTVKNEMMNEAFRQVTPEFVALWEEMGWKKFYIDNKDKLYLGIRLNYVNLYYKRGCISKIELKNRKGKKPELCAKINKRYWDNAPETSSDYVNIELEELERDFGEIVKKIDSMYENTDKKYAKTYKEYIAEQKLFINNNKNKESEWYCVDMEYTKSEKGDRKKSPGRFDIIAISKKRTKGKHNVALIELKYGAKSISGDIYKSGACGHMADFFEFMKDDNDDCREYLAENIKRIVRSYRQLTDDFPADIGDDFDTMHPEYYFITLNSNLKGEKNNAKKQMQKYLLNGKGHSKNNFQKVCGIDVSKADNIKFLFSDYVGDDINKILCPDQYQGYGLR